MSNNLIVRLQGISKAYNGEEVLVGLDLDIERYRFLTLLGPSGCGKTTTLRIIGGFETPSSGKVFFDGQDITTLPSHKRKVNTVFQKYALFPHMNIFENVAFGLRIKKTSESDIKKMVEQMLELVNLKGFEKRSVDSLSGGQQQRVAIARALVNSPDVLLLDEPLGALDLKLRKEMQMELKNIQQRLGITFVYVTHDQEEALTMSDLIVVMKDGVIQQSGSPQDIYNEPANSFVADFIGESNIVTGIMHHDFDVSFGGVRFECADKGFVADEEVDVVIRPEDLKLVKHGKGKLDGIVKSIVFKGVHYEMVIASNMFDWIVHSTVCEPVGAMVGLDVLPFDIHIMRKTSTL